MAQHSKNSELFLTNKYKRFLNSNGILYFLVEELFWAILCLIGILPTAWLSWLLARSFNKLMATPIWQLFSSINNLMNERKQFKSIVMLTILCLSMVVGGLLGYFILFQSSLFMGNITTFLTQISSPPAITFFGAMIGNVIATLSNKIPPFIGVLLGTMMGSYLPITIPLILDVVFVSALTTAVITGFVTKQLLRIHYKNHYGSANADGYELNRSLDEQNEFIANQAQKFNVHVDEFKTLTTYCRDQIQKIKKGANFFEEYCDIRRLKTNTYKDIYHQLMNPKIEDKADIEQAKKLLKLSSATKILEDTKDLGSMTRKEIKYLPSFFVGFHLKKTGEEMRILTHQLFLDDGIEDNMIRPFLADKS